MYGVQQHIEYTRQRARNANYNTLKNLIDEAAGLGETEINVPRNRITGIEDRLRAAGYRLTEWEGANGDYYGNWVEIAW